MSSRYRPKEGKRHPGYAKAIETLQKHRGFITRKALAKVVKAAGLEWNNDWTVAARKDAGVGEAPRGNPKYWNEGQPTTTRTPPRPRTVKPKSTVPEVKVKMDEIDKLFTPELSVKDALAALEKAYLDAFDRLRQDMDEIKHIQSALNKSVEIMRGYEKLVDQAQSMLVNHDHAQIVASDSRLE